MIRLLRRLIIKMQGEWLAPIIQKMQAFFINPSIIMMLFLEITIET